MDTAALSKQACPSAIAAARLLIQRAAAKAATAAAARAVADAATVSIAIATCVSAQAPPPKRVGRLTIN